MITEKHRKFAAYWEELGKPQLEYKNVEGMRGSGLWSCVLDNMPSWDDLCHYRIAGDRHWELRLKWVNSDKQLLVEINENDGFGWEIDGYPMWNQGNEYREHKQAEAKRESPLLNQVGGDHYRNMKIQPAEYTHANGIGHLAGDAIAYISRYKSKNGRQDLEKAVHSIQLLIQLEYGDE